MSTEQAINELRSIEGIVNKAWIERIIALISPTEPKPAGTHLDDALVTRVRQLIERTFLYSAWTDGSPQVRAVAAFIQEHIESLRTAPQATQERSASTWQPIETAPKTGKEILYKALRPQSKAYFYGSMAFRSPDTAKDYWWDDSATMEVESPVGWMEIP